MTAKGHRPVPIEPNVDAAGTETGDPPSQAYLPRPVTLACSLPLRVAFISDLHLFTSRTTAARWRPRMAAAIADADVCIWGGDLFDLRWSTMSVERSVAAAIDYLRDWCDEFPKPRFVYLRGNHDAHEPLEQAIAESFADDQRWLHLGESVRIGSAIFVHGDVIERDRRDDGFTRYRRRWRSKPPAPRWRHGVYNHAVRMRLHRMAAGAAHRHDRTCRRLLRWLDRVGVDRANVRDLAFGHTHRVIRGRWVDGVRFHNGGAAIRHVPFEPVRLTIQPESEFTNA